MATLDFWKYRKPASAPSTFPGADELRIGIVHARWNAEVIDALMTATVETLLHAGVRQENIVVESVPGSWELPFGALSVIEAAQVEAEGADEAGDEAGQESSAGDAVGAAEQQGAGRKTKLDAMIGIGVLIKGHTMHFEYIADSCCNGLMQLGMETKTPVILGLLCCLNEDQALERAGIGRGEFPGHNHGVDWANAALEMAIKRKGHVRGELRLME